MRCESISSFSFLLPFKIVLHLISILKEFNEWGQIFVITLLKKYIPDNQDELFAIMV
jgi:hypothetical protein